MISQRELDSKMEHIREYRRDAETLLEVLSGLRQATEAIQETPKKDRKRSAPRG